MQGLLPELFFKVFFISNFLIKHDKKLIFGAWTTIQLQVEDRKSGIFKKIKCEDFFIANFLIKEETQLEAISLKIILMQERKLKFGAWSN